MSTNEHLKVVSEDEEKRIEEIGNVLEGAYLQLKTLGLYADKLADIENIYEWYLDAVMYGYYRAVIEGWPEDQEKWKERLLKRAERAEFIQNMISTSSSPQ